MDNKHCSRRFLLRVSLVILLFITAVVSGLLPLASVSGAITNAVYLPIILNN